MRIWRVPSAPNPVTLRNRPNEDAYQRTQRSRSTIIFPFRRRAPRARAAVTVQRWADAQEKLERVAEIVAVVAIERIGAVVDGELGAETDVDAVAVRQVADVTERVPAHWKNFGFIEGLRTSSCPDFCDAFPAKINRVAATLII